MLIQLLAWIRLTLIEVLGYSMQEFALFALFAKF
jgi:hypothetical protein